MGGLLGASLASLNPSHTATTMRGCQPPVGSRVDNPTRLCTRVNAREMSKPCGAACVGPASTAVGAFTPASCFATRTARRLAFPGNAIHIVRTVTSIPATGSTPEHLTPEEEAAFQEFLQQRKAERKAWKDEMRRRAKFNPMAAPPQPAGAPAGAPSPLGAAAAPSQPLAPPQPRLAALSRPRPPSAAAASAAVGAPAGSHRRPQAPPRTAARVSKAPRLNNIVGSDTGDDDEMGDEELDLDAMAAMARKVMQDGNEEEDEDDDDDEGGGGRRGAAERVRSAAAASSSGRGAAAAAAGGRRLAKAAGEATVRRLGEPAPKRQLMPIAQLQRRRAAAAAEAREDQEEEAEEERVAGAAPGVEAGADGAAGRRSAAAIGRGLRVASPSSAAAAPAAAVGSKPGRAVSAGLAEERDEDEVEEDELDWDALQVYEKYEQYVNEVAEDEQRQARAAARRAAAAARSGARTSQGAKAGAAIAPTGLFAASPSSSPSASTTSAAGSRGTGRAGGRLPVPGDTSATDTAPPAARRQGKRNTSSDMADRLDEQLDRWEQLVGFFKVVERDSRREEARKRRKQQEEEAMQAVAEEAEAADARRRQSGQVTEARGTEARGTEARGTEARGTEARGTEARVAIPSGAKAAAAAAAVAAGAAGVPFLAEELEELGLGGDDDEDAEEAGEAELDWLSLERMFLGDGWERELGELKAKVEQGAREVEAAMAAQEGGEGSPLEPWRDEVSNLLLGLVEISAKRYLGRSLLVQGAGQAGAAQAAAVGEEERAAVFWEAPFLLLVQDDSPDPVLDYVNRAALEALRLGTFDDATGGVPVAGLMDPADPRSQQDWLWALQEAAERVERYSTIPSLRLRGPGPESPVVEASDVTLFRVDSLEEQPIGQALVASRWRVLPPPPPPPRGAV